MNLKVKQRCVLKNKEEVFDNLTKLMNELFEVPISDIKMDSHFYDDLNLDSIDAIDLIGQFQVLIGERVDPEDFKAVRTVQDVVQIAEQMIERRSSAS